MPSGWRRSRRRLALATAVVALVAVVALGLFAAYSGTPSGAVLRVTVPSGATFRVAADSLGRAGLVASPSLFRWYARLTGRDRDIKAGTYLLQHGRSWNSLVNALRAGQGLERRLTIPEGWSLREIVPALARVLDAPVDSVRAAVRDTALVHALDLP
ncbi:MAG: endolytic transglycosylase MltG, partial [Gemmatimonadaceae bacterium]